jgi:hypothetical protein
MPSHFNHVLKRVRLVIAVPGLVAVMATAPYAMLNASGRATDDSSMKNSAGLIADFPVSGASLDDGIYVGEAANGEKIPHPASRATYSVNDGAATVLVPEGMAYVPAGSFVGIIISFSAVLAG